MKIRNPAPLRPERQIRGISSGLRAGVRGITVRDGVTDVHPVLDIKFQGAVVTELDDDTAVVTIGGSGGSGGPGTGGDPGQPSGVLFSMLNNSGQDLLPGDVVVVDDSADRAVTITTTAGDIHIAGVVQEPIPEDGFGLVLFNGYTPVINAPDAVRGEYAQTSTTATMADATTDREAGSFGVLLTGTDFPDFAQDEATTLAETPVQTLSIDMPTLIEGQMLFLALWLEDGVTDVAVAGGWTRIGSTDGYYYYTRPSTGEDTASATWTTSSVAVATVLLLHPNVQVGAPVEDFDYDATASAASVGSLSDAPRYALAGVRSDVTTPGSGFVRLGGGAAGFTTSGTPALVQSVLDNTSTPIAATFSATPTTGNAVISIPWKALAATGDPTYVVDARVPGVIDPQVTNFGYVDTVNFGGAGGVNGVGIQGKIVSSDTYAGPYWQTQHSDGASGALLIMEFENIGISGYEVATLEGTDTSPIDLGTFTVGPDDLVIMALVSKKDGYNGPDPAIGVNGFTQIADQKYITEGWCWAGYKVGDGDASITYTPFGGGWAAIAIHLVNGTQGAAGTLAGKYIGHGSSATSPFTGSDEDDAIFAVNLSLDAKPSALLYGPDLATGGSTTISDAGGYFTATDVENALQELASKDIGFQSHGNMGGTETFSALVGWHAGTLNADCTFTFSGATSGLVASMVLELTEDGTGGWQPTWPGSVVWPGGTPPTHDDTAGTTTIYLFQSRDGGTTWYGFQAGSSGSTSPLTTKGDLWGYDTADARVPVGANTYLLVADSTDAQGVVWKDPQTTGHFEILMNGATPGEPIDNGAGDWIYVWVSS